MLLWALTIHHKIIDEEVRFCLKFWRKIQILIQKLLEAYAWQRKHQKIKNKKPKASSYSVRCSVIIYTNRSYEASATNRTFLPHEQKKKLIIVCIKDINFLFWQDKIRSQAQSNDEKLLPFKYLKMRWRLQQ